jgi:hypothetical protein
LSGADDDGGRSVQDVGVLDLDRLVQLLAEAISRGLELDHNAASAKTGSSSTSSRGETPSAAASWSRTAREGVR